MERFEVPETCVDPETRRIERGEFHELIEAMYQSLGVNYGGDRSASLRVIEDQLGSPEAQAFMDEQIRHYVGG